MTEMYDRVKSEVEAAYHFLVKLEAQLDDDVEERGLKIGKAILDHMTLTIEGLDCPEDMDDNLFLIIRKILKFRPELIKSGESSEWDIASYLRYLMDTSTKQEVSE